MSESDEVVIGRNIRMAREDRGISQTELADKMRAQGFEHWRQTTTSRVERGKQRLRPREVVALEGMLGPIGAGTSFARAAQLAGGVMSPMSAAIAEKMKIASGQTLHEIIAEKMPKSAFQQAVEQMASQHAGLAAAANTREVDVLRRMHALEDTLEAALVELRALRAEVEDIVDGE